MPGEVNRVAVRINGSEYVLRGNDPEDYLRSLAFVVNDRIGKIRQERPQYSTVKVTTLACLQLADELTSLQKQYEKLLLELETATK